ncbi:MAG: hypothetical protein LBS77_02360 [Desulfovibrio sp.]|nr:hypothetical protein [Desulfovibrio sp.]
MPWIFPLLLFALWQTGFMLDWINTRVLPSPLEVFLALFSLAGSTVAQHINQLSQSGDRFCCRSRPGTAAGLYDGNFRADGKTSETPLYKYSEPFHNLALTPLIII